MSGLCRLRRRTFVPYIEGELSLRARRRLEHHLARCQKCARFLERVRAGHQAGRQLGRRGPESVGRPPDFDRLWARIGAALGPRGWGAKTGETVFRPLSVPVALAALGLLLVALSGLLVLSRRPVTRGSAERAEMSADARGSRDFTPLRIADFPGKTSSAVVTEGFVRGVYFDKEEKTLHIKLVDKRQESEPFVICEVRSPGRMAIPQEGSHVRVYGMPRFDSQPGRGWNEVNPVTNIDILKRWP